MAAIQVYGMNPLEGEISVQGSKNGALPIMAGALLHKGTTVLYNVPDIEDTRCMTDILREIGCRCVKTGSRLVIDAVFVDRTEVPGKYVKAMRSSIILVGSSPWKDEGRARCSSARRLSDRCKTGRSASDGP